MPARQNQFNRIWHTITRTHPSAFLLGAQLLILVSYAVFDGYHAQRALISAVSVLVLGLRVWTIEHTPGPNWLAWVLALPTLVFTLLSVVSNNVAVLALSALFEAALYFYTAFSLIAYMLSDYKVTVDELFAVGATFTLLAWGFAYLSLLCQTLLPGSFVSSVDPKPNLTFIELLFTSFTNLSATGLSDIVPASAWARVVMMLEQFTGVGYVAMVVSRLVALTTQRQERHGEH